eukprot:TRINITY_DN5280_c0_g1_i6.p1 TRINITY_DN5280_c0_g1~~TRINITY_DN5280_c0_g1_i6.p1  ORF type:complete len:514 (-),score=92.66 TRINITY_DN5280_c0_g1_i6:324-1865(-)
MATEFTISHANVKKQQALSQEGKSLILKALKIEEDAKDTNDLDKRLKALPLYKEGIVLLETAVGLYLPPRQHNAPALNRAHDLRSKIKGNLEVAKERRRFIESEQRQEELSKKPSLTSNLIKIYDDDKPSNDSSNSRPEYHRPSSLQPLPRSNRAAEMRMANNRTNIGGNPSSYRDFSPSTSRAAGGTSMGASRADAAEDRERKKLLDKCLSIKGLDPKMVESIVGEVIVKNAAGVKFDDISGQDKAKGALREMVVLPALKPELFTGLRSPAKGLLLFGPPGNGKTLLARALATESSCHLINVSASSLTSKWVGEGEKLVKTLFSVARKIQPCIIFMDEIDSLLSSRRDGENESSRRIKTEFLLQFEGMLTESDEKLVVLAATNRPQELDDAALRRFTKRIYVEMPDLSARKALMSALLKKNGSNLSANELDKLGKLTNGYSCSDITNLAKDAAMAPLREMSQDQILNMKAENMRKLKLDDFLKSSERVRRSLNPSSLAQYVKWNQEYGDIST